MLTGVGWWWLRSPGSDGGRRVTGGGGVRMCVKGTEYECVVDCEAVTSVDGW